jgi:chromosomal replication initiation ATPase DnaA
MSEQFVLSIWRGHMPAKRAWRDVIASTAEDHGLTAADLVGTRRDQRAFRARAEAMHVLRSTTSFSLPQIGRFFNRDHTTVLSALRRHAQFQEAAE